MYLRVSTVLYSQILLVFVKMGDSNSTYNQSSLSIYKTDTNIKLHLWFLWVNSFVNLKIQLANVGKCNVQFEKEKKSMLLLKVWFSATSKVLSTGNASFTYG